MRALELKIPPPVVALLVAAATWCIAMVTWRLQMSVTFRDITALAIAIAGAGISVSGVLAFRNAHTTINPLKPEGATYLVTSGVYRLTRNPMYLGLNLVLFAWALFLAAPWAFVGPLVFVLYMTRFQIVPEEKVLADLFGPAFTDYQTKVRRWI